MTVDSLLKHTVPTQMRAIQIFLVASLSTIIAASPITHAELNSKIDKVLEYQRRPFSKSQFDMSAEEREAYANMQRSCPPSFKEDCNQLLVYTWEEVTPNCQAVDLAFSNIDDVARGRIHTEWWIMEKASWIIWKFVDYVKWAQQEDFYGWTVSQHDCPLSEKTLQRVNDLAKRRRDAEGFEREARERRISIPHNHGGRDEHTRGHLARGG